MTLRLVVTALARSRRRAALLGGLAIGLSLLALVGRPDAADPLKVAGLPVT
jgi:hypothetical protein